MKINNFSVSPHFQKKLMATCNAMQRRSNFQMRFYQLEDSDKDYFEGIMKNSGWKRSKYALIVHNDIKKQYYPIDSVYVVEDDENNCLGFMEADLFDDKKARLEFIEVKLSYQAKNIARTKKYIGETMLNFLAQFVFKSGKEVLLVPFADRSAVGFYKKSAFTKEDELVFHLSKRDMKELEKINLKHNKNVINFERQI